METVLNFLADNYLWFMIGAGILLLALLGFIFDGRKKKKEEGNAQLPQGGQVNTVQNLNAQAMQQQAVQGQPVAPAQPVTGVPTAPAQPTLEGLDAQVPQANPTGEALTFGPVDASAPAEPAAEEEEKLVIEMPNGSLSEEVLESAPGIPQQPVEAAPQESAPLTIEQAVGVESSMPSQANQIPIQESGPSPVMAAPEMSMEPTMAAPEMPAAPAEPMPVSMTPEPAAPAPVAPAQPEPVAPAQPVAPQPVYQNTIQQ